MNNYVLNDEIGQGSFSTIYKGRYRSTTEFYAIASIDKTRRERVVNCVQLLRSMRHPNVIEFHNWYETNNHLWIITEYCTGGDMATILKSKIQLKTAAVQAFGRDIAIGLLYIHSKGVVYNDLQTRNLLMDSAAMLRFHDFSLACSFSDATTRPLIGTPLYMAPELFMCDKPIFSIASDLWSFGCVLHELATGNPPFASTDLEALLTEILTSPTPRVTTMPDSFQKLLNGLLEKDPLRRYTWDDVARSDFWDEAIALPSSGLPSHPGWEDFKRARATRSGASFTWTTAEARAVVAHAVAAAKSNTTAHNVEEKESAAATLNVAKELDFTSSAEQRAALRLEPTSSGRTTHSADNGTTAAHAANTNSSASTHGSPSRSSYARNARSNSGQGGSISAQPRNSRVAEGNTGGPQRRRGSKGRGGATSRDAAGAAMAASAAYDGGRAAFGTNQAGASDERPTETALSAFAGGALRLVPLADLLPHATDQHIRPLSNNSRIEYTPEASYDANTLGFTALTAAEINALSTSKHTAFFRSLYLALSSTRNGHEPIRNVMNYIMTLCSDPEVARASVNSSVMRQCVKHAGRKDAPASFRATAALIMGLLVRTTAFITDEVASSSILADIMQLFEDETDITVKRKLIACIGEFLFYVAVQNEAQRQLWNVQPATVRRIFLSALDSRDDVLKHYAAKMIENMASTPQKEMAMELFTEPVFVEKLLAVFALPQLEGRSEDMRSDAACAAFKLAMMKEELILTVMQSKDVPVTSYASVMQRSTVTHLMQILMTFLNHVLVKGLTALKNPFMLMWAKAAQESRSNRSANLFVSSLSTADAEEIVGNVLFVSEEVLEHLSEAIEQASVAVYGKTLLFVSLIGCVGGLGLCRVLGSRTVTFLDRLVRDTDKYVRKCALAMSEFLGWFISDKLASIARRVSSTSTPTHLAVIQQLLNSSAIRNGIDFQTSVFQSLATCIDKAMNNTLYGTYENDFNSVADRFVESPVVVLKYEDSICQHLVTSYAEMLGRKDTSGRFAAVRFLTSAMVPIAAEGAESRKESGSAATVARKILNVVSPNLASLLQETSPIPVNTMRLLMTCGEMAQSTLSRLVTERLLGVVLEYINNSGGDDDMFYPLSFLHVCLLACTQVDILNYVVRQGLLTLVLRALASALKEKNEQRMEVCCVLLAEVLRRVTADATSRVTVKCAESASKDTISTVLLPICVDTNNSVAVMESAASAMEDYARLSALAREDLTSPATLSAYIGALSNALYQPAKRTVATRLLTALNVSCASSSSEVLQSLSRNSRLLAVLKTASGTTNMRMAATEADKLLKLLS
jgi:serine/threonine-protein kinase ULK4